MSTASSRAKPGAGNRIERFEPWIAALVSALLHVAMLLIILYAAKPSVTSPQGAAHGSRMKVDFIGESRQAEAIPSPPPPAAPVSSPIRSTLVERAPDPLPPPDQARRPSPPDRTPPRPSEKPAASASADRHPQTWTGHPPGMQAQDVADYDDGLGTSAAEQGSSNDAMSATPTMEVGGYQVIYDLRSETQLRAWKAQGMKEIAVPLPGTQYRMVCPLEIALRRGSGKCRLLYPDSPEMTAIGEGREVINMIQVYRHGERVWSGPGPYR